MFSPVSERPSSLRRFSLFLAVVLISVVLGLVLAGRQVWYLFRNPEEVRALLKGWGVWAPLGVFVLQLIQIVVAPLPGNVMAFVGGYALGFWPTVVWLMFGVLAGATVAFLIARIFGRRLLKLFVPAAALERFDSFILHRGTFYIFLLLLVPNPLGDWVYYLAGLTGVPLLFFLLLVLIARLPSNILECAVGASATRFGFREWLVLLLVVAVLAGIYLLNQRRIEKLLERLSSREG